jgi:hypothetical protein
MNYDMLLAGAIGVAPALALMYWTMKDYTYPIVEKPFFDDRKLFPMLAVGMIVGVVLITVQNSFNMAFILFALIFAVLEELVKLVILNFKRFQKRLDTPFYGLVLGLGIGSTMGFGAVWVSMLALGSVGQTLNAADYVILTVVAIQFVVLNGATGALIGMGVTRGYPFNYFANATLTHIAVNLVMIGFYTFPDFWRYVCLVGATGIAIFAYWQMHKRTLPELISTEVAKFEARSKV